MPLKARFYSLDVFRGATVALMILVNNPGSWSHIYRPLEHARWHGCTPTDLVFPFFLFAVGNAMAFVFPRFAAAGTASFLKKVLQRSFLIFLIGLLLNWSPFVQWQQDHLVFKSPGSLRIFGVLQRIAICYLFASLVIYFSKPKATLVISVLLLAGYWLLCFYLGNPADPFSLEGFWGTRVDRALLGNNHIYKGEGVPFDPEGLVSSIAAIVQVITGYFIGRFIRSEGMREEAVDQESRQKEGSFRMVALLFIAGLCLLLAGYWWDMIFPINKKIWSSSFVLYSSGVATMLLAMMIFLIETRGFRGFITRFFVVFGKNPLFIFVLSGFLPRLLGLIRILDHRDPKGQRVYLSPFGWFYQYICKPLTASLELGSLFYALCLVCFYWLIVYWLDKRKIYVRV